MRKPQKDRPGEESKRQGPAKAKGLFNSGTSPVDPTCVQAHTDDTLMREVVSLLKQGNFSYKLQNKLDELWADMRQRKERDWRYYKVAAMVSEVNYHLDRPEKAMVTVADGPHLLKQLQQAEGVIERKLAREQIRCCQAYAQATHYHQHEYERACEFLLACREFVMKRLKTSYGTRAQNSYYLGKTYRQMNMYDPAESMFIDAIEKYQKRAEARKQRRQNIDNEVERERLRVEENLFINRRVGIALGLGLGWLDYTRGRLDAAYQKILTAKALSSGYEDELNDAYLDLICGSIWRCQAGSDFDRRGKLKTALTRVGDAYRTFENSTHLRYQARAAYELALINLALADYENAPDHFHSYLAEARKKTDEVIRKATQTNSWRWISNAQIVQSRIKRKEENYSEADTIASNALKLAEDHGQTLCIIDACIARAEARLLLAKDEITKRGLGDVTKPSKSLIEARRDLERALELNVLKLPRRTSENQNVKIQVVCSLYLAKSFALEGLPAAALERFPHREALREIEHVDIELLADEVWAEIQAVRAAPFNISWDAPELKYHPYHDGLKEFLLMCARQRGAKSQSQLARFLGVQRRTIRKWQRDLKNKV